MARSRVRRIKITRSGGRTTVRVRVRTTGAKSNSAARRIARRVAKKTARRILKRETRTKPSTTRRIVKVPTMKWRTKAVARHISKSPRSKKVSTRKRTVNNDN